MRILLAFIALILATPASAYWEYGHETVARIALLNIKPSTRAAIDRLLARQALLETPTCPARTLPQASVWADCIKPLDDRFSYAYSWHYQNVDICKPFELKSACKDGNCVSAQIDRNAKLLADKDVPIRERVMALAFLTHFVGDLSMPLHAGDKGDLGGNRQRTNYGLFQGKRTNLHSVWDGYLAERAISTPPSLVRHYTAEEAAPIAAGTTEDWSRDSWEVAKSAYAAALGGDPCGETRDGRFDEPAIATQVQPARDQIVKGGLRLARLLDEALG
jgi:hypothetical protein